MVVCVCLAWSLLSVADSLDLCGRWRPYHPSLLPSRSDQTFTPSLNPIPLGLDPSSLSFLSDPPFLLSFQTNPFSLAFDSSSPSDQTPPPLPPSLRTTLCLHPYKPNPFILSLFPAIPNHMLPHFHPRPLHPLSLS